MDFKKELENYTFHDLFDIDEVQKLQDLFSAATGVAAIITEPDGTPITKPSNFSLLCKNIIRKTELGYKNCMKSDSALGGPKKDGPRIQKCLSAGLMDAGTSIMIGDYHIASYLIGQVMIIDEEPDGLLRYADEIGADKKEFENCLKHVTKMTKEQFENIANFLFLNAQYLSELAINNLMQRIEIQRRIDAEKRLFAEKELFKVTLQSIGDGVITTDIEGKITSINNVATLLTGWASGEAIGLPFEEVFRINFPNPIRDILENGKTVTLDSHTSLISKCGKEYIIADSGAPIKDERGKILGAVIVFRDITEERNHLPQMKNSLQTLWIFETIK